MNKIVISLSLSAILCGTLIVHSHDYEYELAKYEMAAAQAGTDAFIYKEDNMLNNIKWEGEFNIIRDNSQMADKMALVLDRIAQMNEQYELRKIDDQGIILISVDAIDKFALVQLVDIAVHEGFDASIIDHWMMNEMDIEMDNKYEDILMLQYFGPSIITDHKY